MKMYGKSLPAEDLPISISATDLETVLLHIHSVTIFTQITLVMYLSFSPFFLFLHLSLLNYPFVSSILPDLRSGQQVSLQNTIILFNSPPWELHWLPTAMRTKFLILTCVVKHSVQSIFHLKVSNFSSKSTNQGSFSEHLSPYKFLPSIPPLHPAIFHFH